MNSSTCYLIPFLAVGAVAFSACGVDVDFGLGLEKGSGTAETTTFDFALFEGIEASDAFDVEVRLEAGSPTVEITVDDNFTDDLEVRLDGENLQIGFDHGARRFKISPTAIVTVPSLNLIDASDASSITVDGEVIVPTLTLDVSDASRVDVTVDVDNLAVDASDASSITASGRIDSLTVDASDASAVVLTDTSVDSAVINLSDASRALLGQVDHVDGNLSDASHLSAPAAAIDRVETSDGSNIDRR